MPTSIVSARPSSSRRSDATPTPAVSVAVTEVTPASTFYPAEAHHQGYYRKNPGQGYCQAMIGPLVANLRAKYGARLKKSAAS